MLRSRAMGFRLLRRSLLAGGLAALACYSPTLPLPPPGKPEVSEIQGQPGLYRLVGTAQAHAEVFARNQNTSPVRSWGQQTGADGRYDFTVEGQPLDPMELWYVVGKDSSPRVLFQLPPLESGTGGAP